MKEMRELLLKYALLNAVKHQGKAQLNAVISKVFAERPDLRPKARELVSLAKEVIYEVNNLDLEKQRSIIESRWPELLEERKREEKKELPPLPKFERVKKVVTRFAPNPDFVLHLGSARPAILSYEYARRYKGKFILRFEDTDPKTKTPIPEAYKLIKEDLKWLGLKWDEEYIQSLRMEIYYEYAEKLLRSGKAYACTCPFERIREERKRGLEDPCSNLSMEEHLDRWKKMLNGEYDEGEAVLRINTGPHPDPSVRNWIAFRIIDTEKYPHPLTGSKYRVWPTYNFACAIDDHLMGVTYILRAKEHETNTIKQGYIYKFLNWDPPIAIHFGRLNLEDMILSKSKIREGITRGLFKGWDDPRLGTLIALRRRGILPEAIWDLVIDVGIKPSSAIISLDMLHALNRKYLEPKANRYMFVPKPVKVKIYSDSKELKAKIPYHPSFPERGARTIDLKTNDEYIYIYLSEDDLKELKKGSEIRLLGLANVEVVSLNPPIVRVINKDTDYAKRKGLKIVQWVPYGESILTRVVMAKGMNLYDIEGLSEPGLKELSIGAQIQFFRFGFVKLEEKNNALTFIYTHD